MNLKFLKSTYTRFTLIYLLIFCLSVAVLSLVTSTISLGHFENHIVKKMNQEVNQLLVDYNQDGLNELRHDIRERVELNQPGRFLYSILLNDGTREFDRFPIEDTTEGWHTTPKPKDTKIIVIKLRDEGKLIIASNLDDIHLLEKALSTAFFITTLLTIFLGILGGYFLSRHYFKRMNVIRNTAIQIGQGNLHLRLKVENKEDIIDQVAEIINNMVTRIELLLTESQRVASHIAHEMRTPIGHIRQRIEEIITHGNDQKIIQSEAQLIIKDIDRTLETFSGILRLSEINSGMRKVNFKDFNIGAVIAEICETYEPVASENNKKLEGKFHDYQVYGDPTLIRQLLSNAIENSIQHTPDQTTINISLESSGNTCHLIIRDDGPGVSDIEHLKKPFSKIDYPGNRSGFGLGLSLIQAIAKLHDFDIHFKNDGGFIISLRVK